MLQGEPEGLALLHGIREEDLQRERQQLARVRPCCLVMAGVSSSVHRGR